MEKYHLIADQPIIKMKNQKSIPRTSKRRTVLKALAGAGIAGSGLVSVTGAASASEHDWVVDKNGDNDHDTIQAAVNEAEAGDTIKVREGEYREQVALYGWHAGDDLTIIGDPGDPDTVGPGTNAPKLIGNIDETETAAGFRLGQQSGITIKGFEILDFHQDWWGTGIKGGKSNIKLTDNEIHSLSTRGIAVWEGDELEETGFVIKRNNVYDVGEDGIVLGNQSNSIISENRVEGAESPTAESADGDTGMGIRVFSSVGNSGAKGEDESRISENIKILNNTVVGHFHKPGIRLLSINKNDGDLEPKTHSILRNVTARKNEIKVTGGGPSLGVAANGSNGEITRVESVLMEDNVVRTAGEKPGVRIGATKGAKVRDITLADNDVREASPGFIFFDSSEVRQEGVIRNVNVRKNDVRSNEFGMVLKGGIQADEFEIHQNNIMDNETLGLYYVGKETLSAEKNHWGSPTGPKRKNPAGKFIGKGEKIIGEIDVTPWEPKEI